MPAGRAGRRLASRRAAWRRGRGASARDHRRRVDPRGPLLGAGGGGPSGRRRVGAPGAAGPGRRLGNQRRRDRPPHIRRGSHPRGRRGGSTDPGDFDRRGLRRRPAGATGGDRPGAAALALRGQQGGRRGRGPRGGAPDRPPCRGGPAVSAHRRGPKPGLRRAGLRRAATGGARCRGRRQWRRGTWLRCATSSTSGTWFAPTASCSSTARRGRPTTWRGATASPSRRCSPGSRRCIGTPAVPAADPSLVRSADIPHLVGDSTKLRRATGWAPTISLDRTLQELVDAQAD